MFHCILQLPSNTSDNSHPRFGRNVIIDAAERTSRCVLSCNYNTMIFFFQVALNQDIAFTVFRREFD